jgi:hypothetical protein
MIDSIWQWLTSAGTLVSMWGAVVVLLQVNSSDVKPNSTAYYAS